MFFHTTDAVVVQFLEQASGAKRTNEVEECISMTMMNELKVHDEGALIEEN